MFSYIQNLFKKPARRPELIEAEIEAARSNYLNELAELRRKYATTFLALYKEHKAACTQTQ